MRTSPEEASNATAEATADGALVVIPCLNEAERLGPLLQRLLSDPGLTDALFVVVDGGSLDATPEIARDFAEREPRVRLLRNPARIQAAGVNLAARTLREGRRWLIRVDAHALYPPDYASRLLAEAERTGADSVVVSLRSVGERCFQKAAAVAQNSRLGSGGAAHRGAPRSGWVDHGHHALFRLDAFLRAGGYDEAFSHNEDAELDVRLAASGARIWLTDAVRVLYLPRTRPLALAGQYFAYGRGRARTVRRHRTRLRLRQSLPLLVPPALLGLCAAPLWPPAAAPAAVWIVGCLAYGGGLGLAARSACGMMAGVAAMLMHLAWALGFLIELANPGAVPSHPSRRIQEPGG